MVTQQLNGRHGFDSRQMDSRACGITISFELFLKKLFIFGCAGSLLLLRHFL